MCCTYLLSFCGLRFHSFILCFGEQEFLISEDLIYWSFLLVFVSCLIKILYYSKVTRMFSELTSKCFSILPFTFRSVIQLGMIFVHGMWEVVDFVVCFVFFLNNVLQTLQTLSYVATEVCVLLTEWSASVLQFP